MKRSTEIDVIQQKLRARVQYWAGRIKVVPTQIRVQPMKRKWASCSTRGWISLSTELLQQPRRFQDYAIVHELLHLEIPNHGRLFKCMMNSFIPEWAAIEKDCERRLAARDCK